MRVLTLNCWNVSPPLEARMALVRAGIAALRPDVIGLQEIVVRRDGFDQAAMILDGLGYHRAFGAAVRWTETEALLPPEHAPSDAFGNVVASRWPIRAQALRPLPGAETGERRSLLATLIETPAGVLPFVTTHLNWRLDHGVVRERQVVVLADFVASWAPAGALPPVVVGDLNAEPDSTEIRFLCGLASLEGRSVYFQDAWRVAGRGRGCTWDNRNAYAALSFEPDRRIDYVLAGAPHPASGRGVVASAALAFVEPDGDVYASDHFGVVADIEA